MTTFDALEGKAFLKKLREKKNMRATNIFSFPHNVFYPITDRINVFVAFNLSSSDAFNLDKLLSSGEGLKTLWT